MPSQQQSNTGITVPFTILEDNGITEAWPNDGPVAKVKFKCLWTDHYQLIHDLKFQNQTSGRSIFRTLPLAYPPSPNLFCTAIDSIEPMGQPLLLAFLGNNWLVKKYAIVTASFTYLTWASDVSSQPFTQTSVGISGEIMTLPGSVFTFSSGQVVPQAVGVVIPQMEVNFKRFFMPYIPVAEMINIVGKINSDTVTLGTAVLTPGTLLFLGGPSDASADTFGSITQTVEYKFMYRPVSWNSLYNPYTNAWEALTPGPYQTAVFYNSLP